MHLRYVNIVLFLKKKLNAMTLSIHLAVLFWDMSKVSIFVIILITLHVFHIISNCHQTVAHCKMFFQQCMYFSYFFMKGIVVGACWNRLIETIPMSTHNNSFHEEIRKTVIWITFYPWICYVHAINFERYLCLDTHCLTLLY